MKKNLKNIITATVASALSFTAIGCSTTAFKVAKNIDTSMEKFVTSINSLDYVDTSSTASAASIGEMSFDSQNRKVGKIVETSAATAPNNYITKSATENAVQDDNNANSKNYEISDMMFRDKQPVKFLNDSLANTIIENTITLPALHKNLTKLYILTDTPFITISSSNNFENIESSATTEKITNTSRQIDEKINTLILKRAILMIYVNEIYSGNVELSNESKVAINAYVNVIKENTSFLNGNRGMVKNQLSLANDLMSSGENFELINFYFIKSGEALEIRLNKLDSSISAIDSITEIIESNLKSNSPYYNSNLSDTYSDFVSHLGEIKNTESGSINENSTDKEIADSILGSLNFHAPSRHDKLLTETKTENSAAKTQVQQNEQQTSSITKIENNSRKQIADNSQNQNASKDADKSVIINTPSIENLKIKNETNNNEKVEINSNHSNKIEKIETNSSESSLAQKANADTLQSQNDELIRINTSDDQASEMKNETNGTKSNVPNSQRYRRSSRSNRRNSNNSSRTQSNSRNNKNNSRIDDYKNYNSGNRLISNDKSIKPSNKVPLSLHKNETKANKPQTLELRDEDYDKIKENNNGGKRNMKNGGLNHNDSEKIMRANRSPEKISSEQYQSDTNRNQNFATTMKYKNN